MTPFILSLAALATFRLAELIAFDAGPFHMFKKWRDLWKKHPYIHELFTCYYCQSAWWAIVTSVYVWYLDLISLGLLPLFAVAVGGLAVGMFRLLPDR